MRRLVRLLFVVGLGLAGCRAQPYVNAHLETLNAEYRQLEDYVYALEEENARLNAELQALRTQRTSPDGESRPSRGLFRSRPGNPPARRSPGSGSPGGDGMDGIEPPQIEIPTSTTTNPLLQGGSSVRWPNLLSNPPEGRTHAASHSMVGSSGDGPEKAGHGVNESRESPEDLPPSTILPPPVLADAASADRGQGMAIGPDSARGHPSTLPDASSAVARASVARRSGPPTRLMLDPQQCRGADWDGRPGDDGLQLVVQALTREGEEALLAGKLAIVVLDPSRQGDAARLARWDFDAAATAQLLAASPPSIDGLRLELPWPGDPPMSNRLTVFVRLETEDGRRLETHRDVFIIPPGQQIGGWTPRAKRRLGPAEPRGGDVIAAGHHHEEGIRKPSSSTRGEAGDAVERRRISEPELPVWSPAR